VGYVLLEGGLKNGMACQFLLVKRNPWTYGCHPVSLQAYSEQIKGLAEGGANGVG